MVALLYRRSSSSCLVSRLLVAPTPRRATLACADRGDGDVRVTRMCVMCAWVAGDSRRRSRAGVDYPALLLESFSLRTPLAGPIRVPFPSFLRRALVGARAHERAHDVRRARCAGVTVRSTRRAGVRACARSLGVIRVRARARAGWAPPPPVSVGQRAARAEGWFRATCVLGAWCLGFPSSLVRLMQPVRGSCRVDAGVMQCCARDAGVMQVMQG